MKTKECYTVTAHELTLKGKKRGWFERILERNIRQHLNTRGIAARIERTAGRLLIHTPHASQTDSILSRIFGIHHAWRSHILEGTPPPEDILRVLSRMVPHNQPFTITVKRAWKTYPLTSLELKRFLGTRLAKAGYPAQLNAMDEIRIDILPDKVLIHTTRIPGPGGLPQGVTGRVLCLLSGGIDSPVAAWLLMKRGVHVDFLHYHTFKTNEDARRTKIARIIERLNAYQLTARLWLQPYHAYQLRMHGRIPSKLDLVAFRLYMLRQAWRLAQREGYHAVCTGDNLGQVASQTMQNMQSTSLLSNAFILRPLLTYDKEEIIHLAKRIGTYEESIKPYRDCCSIISQYPATRVTYDHLHPFLPHIDQVIRDTLHDVSVFTISTIHEE